MRQVMIVDDSAAMRGLIASVLAELKDVKIIEMGSAFEALKVMTRDTVDLFLLDINMPGINGLELLAFIRKNSRYIKTPVVIVSMEGATDDKRRGLSLGANAYVKKPFQSEELLSTVKGLLG